MTRPDPPFGNEPPPICRFEELARRENRLRRELQDRGSELHRFLTAQDGVFDIAIHEIRQGRKRTHWIWFVFPQLRGLGHSDIAQRYGIATFEEAAEFLGHPVLGPRLRLAVNTLQDLVGKSAEEVFGSVDARKLRSCLTLFGRVDGSGLFGAALERWFGGHEDEATLSLLTTSKRGD